MKNTYRIDSRQANQYKNVYLHSKKITVIFSPFYKCKITAVKTTLHNIRQ